jgi:hypothetical protein
LGGAGASCATRRWAVVKATEKSQTRRVELIFMLNVRNGYSTLSVVERVEMPNVSS